MIITKYVEINIYQTCESQAGRVTTKFNYLLPGEERGEAGGDWDVLTLLLS